MGMETLKAKKSSVVDGGLKSNSVCTCLFMRPREAIWVRDKKG